jgi:hypothetical protein
MMKDSFSQDMGDNDNDASLLIALANVLETLIDANKKYQSAPQVVTKFQCSYAPDVSIISYLERIRKYAKCSDCCFVISLIYIDRMIESCNVVLTSLNVHRLLITSIMLSAKFLDDLFYNNAFYAKLGGVSVTELNALEIEFLQKIHFSLYVSPESYCKYLSELRRFTGTDHPIPSSVVASPSLSIVSSAGSTNSSEVIYGSAHLNSNSSEYSPTSVVAVSAAVAMHSGTWSYDQCIATPNIAPFSDQSAYPNQYSDHHHQYVSPSPPPPPTPHLQYLNQFYHQSNDQMNFNNNSNWQEKGRNNMSKFLFNSYRPSLVVSSL